MRTEGPVLTVRTFVQSVDFEPGASYGPRVLPDYELVWVLAGSAEWHTRPLDTQGHHGAAERHVLRPGTLALARKGSFETYYWSPSTMSRHAYVHFDIHDTGRLGDPSTWPSVRDTTDSVITEAVCSHLLDLARLRSDCSRSRSDELVGILLDLFVDGPVQPQPDDLHPALRQAIHHVIARWRTDGMRIVPTAELAAAAGLSTGHLHHLFRQRFHEGPARVLELVRLARAAAALQRSNASLSDIAHDCGFANPYHFSRRFTTVYKLPPGAFRRLDHDTDPLGPVRDAELQALAQILLSRG